MFVGKTPFIDQTEYLIFQKIKNGQFSTNSLVLLLFIFFKFIINKGNSR